MPISTMRFNEQPRSAPNSQNGNHSGRHHVRRPTYPLSHAMRRKPRRWPLVLRFVKGAIHGVIILPVLLHALFTVLIVCLDEYTGKSFGLPATIVPSLSIVVGLMLVFRNQTCYNRFWDGRNNLTTIITSVRNLTRTVLTCSHDRDPQTQILRALTPIEHADIERVVKVLIAIPYAVKNHLRAEWGTSIVPGAEVDAHTGILTFNPEYSDLLPKGLRGYEDQGLGLPLQLTFFVESFIKRGFERGWFHGPQASQLQVQLNTLTDSYGKMETIKMTPIPIAHLIHQKQVLALFGCVLPFALVDDMAWWTIPVVSLVMFTLYGIEGIGSQLEDPFGYDRNDIKMDGIVEDVRMEVGVMLDEWRRAQRAREASVGGEERIGREMFVESAESGQEGWGYVMR